MGRPKLEFDHAKETFVSQICSNTELEECRKVTAEKFELESAIFQFLLKLVVFCNIILWATLVMERPKLKLDHVKEAKGNRIHVNTELER